ncbi:MAG: hypothetical protein ACK5B9_14770 [Flavobacteriia bacterium]
MKKESKNVTFSDSKLSDTLTFDDIKGNLFYINPTDDSYFCDLSKIIETDCGIGYFYFNKLGKVTFTFECVGDTSIVYILGSYEVNKSIISCNFEYSFECFFDSIGNSFKGKGNLVKEKELIKMEIYKANCKDVFGFNNGAEKSEEKEFYVLQKASKTQNEIFWNFFKSSKVKSEYL